MADWNPALYRRFEDERTRPARDLLAPQITFQLADIARWVPGEAPDLLTAHAQLVPPLFFVRLKK